MLHIIINTILLWFCIFGAVKSIEWVYKNAYYYIKKIICYKNKRQVYITRRQILIFARAHYEEWYGLCGLLNWTLQYHGIYRNEREVFPLFTNENAIPFNARHADVDEYWWPIREWNTGRLQFLDWLIDQYKDDPTDLTTLNP